ncbi:ABC transporter substrate-binding protein [Paenibacillus sp. SYP-B3998]|uniref:ABC transporter substrate-binding protein n=1 Tax=Paenibacillus sp. SYP-B3998 TaxID=2678564 RepID=A0A6G3ZV37_9BACL|nr:ABC transporter substrate-binding protein [Paenibacillus sp. SYP-B3998]NEW05908.1 ABC transporter substrate-binding protein [Paenibacillus sp. SYP-B3998]
MKKNTINIMLLFLAMMIILSGCGNSVATNPAVTDAKVGASNQDENQKKTKKIVDMSGKEAELPIKVSKVVNSWPSSATMMIFLGAGDKLTGIHKYVKTLPFNELIYPNLQKIPSSENNPEELLKLAPEVIITTADEDVINYAKVGLKGANLMFNDYKTMKQSVSILGDILGDDYKSKTDKLVAYIDGNLKKVQAAFKDLPDKDKPLVYYAVGDMYSTTGAGTIMEEWVNYGGGKYATSDLGKGMRVKVTPEDILKKNPDIIVISGGEGSEDVVKSFKTTPEWREINAVKNNKIFVVPSGCFAWDRFGAESALQILWAASTFHPDLFKIDMKAETRNFYKEYSNFNITDSQLEQLLKGKVVK